MVKRLLATIPVMAVMAVFVFSLLRLTPGDPAAVIAGDHASPRDVEQIRHKPGLKDGLMAIPGIFLTIALMALMSASVRNVVIALAVPEIPRVVRLLRALVLSLRQQPFVGARSPRRRASPRILFRHIMPNTLAAVIVQGTYNCASVVIVEAYPSFLGAAPRTSRAGGT
jgi:ABC-type dipeptide/oligopeptide/nickel transport system permease subunit